MKSFVCAAVCLLVAVLPAAAQVVRVSVSTAGVEADNISERPSISADGRFVAFGSAASNLVAGDTNNFSDIFLRDRDTDADGVFDEPGAVSTTRISLAPGGAQASGGSNVPVITPDGRYIVYISTATNLTVASNPFSHSQIYRFDRVANTTVRVSGNADGENVQADALWPAVSDDGNVVAFISTGEGGLVPGASAGPHVFVRNIAEGQTTLAAEPADWAALTAQQRFLESLTISGDGTRVAYLALSRVTLSQFMQPRVQPVVADLGSGAITPVPGASSVRFLALSASGASTVVASQDLLLPLPPTLQRHVVATGAATPILEVPQGLSHTVSSPSARYVLTSNAWLRDLDIGTSTSLGFVPGISDFSADDRWLAVQSGTATLVAGDTNGVDDVFVLDLSDVLDADDDTMDDRWETLFGVTDPAADPDGDGQTNAQEEDAGTHPNGLVRRFLAEGATGTFFQTRIALANPSTTLAATAVLTFDDGGGTRVRRPIAIPAGRSAVVNVGTVSGFEAADVSATVESDRLLGIQRSMTWGPSSTVPPYGSHAEIAAVAPSTTWFLAEGSTVLDFNVFYLLQNPQTTATQATVRFLLPSGTTITRPYDLPPGSRTTIYLNAIPGLEETDVSGDIIATAPIVVERAMYRNLPGQVFGLGHDSLGVTAAATSWFLAEGATGPFFDLYVLIANPGAIDATVRADYARPDGSVVTQTYTVRAHSRFTVFVDDIQGLANSPVATTLTSTNGVPVVAERAMYWPGGFFDYYEGHSSAGSRTAAPEWVVAGGLPGGLPDDAQTYVLIANTESVAGEATLDILPDRDATGPAPSPLVVALPPNSRTTVPIVGVSGPFGVLVRSTGATSVQMVVESAFYSSGSATWAAGSSALATPVP